MTPITALRPLLLASLLAALAMPAGAAAAGARDTDGDGMPNAFEKRHHLKVKVDDASKDAEHDGLSNLSEYEAHTNPRKRDSDHDGVGDAKEDADDDGVANGVEQKLRTHLDDSDSDDDGKEDGAETAGTVVSFVGNVLTLRAVDGATIVGTVAPTTEIKCNEEDAKSDDGEDDHADRPKPATTTSSDSGTAPGVPSTRDDHEDDDSHAEDRNGEDRSDEDEEDRRVTAVPAQRMSEDSSAGTCNAASIVAGAGVHEAEIENGVFKKVELA